MSPPASSDEPEALEDLPEPGSDLDELAAKVLRKTVRASPGLLVSLAFHGVLLALLPLVVFYERLREPDVTPVKISVDALRIDPDRNYKPVSSAPPSADGHGLDDPPLFAPDAAFAERNESVSKNDRSRIEGDQEAVLMHTTNEELSGARGRRNEMAQFGVHDSMGVGGGAGRGAWRYGGDAGGRRNLVARGGGSAVTEAAVERGLAWLARHQSANGCFSAEHHRCAKCDQPAKLPLCDVPATALAVVAFLTAGYTPGTASSVRDPSTGRTLNYSDTVTAGLDWLVAQQKKDGLVGEAAFGKETRWPTIMYGHAFATMALCDAARVTSACRYQAAANAAVRWLEQAQNPGSGWQYRPSSGTSDTSVTGACVQALRAARLAGIPVGRSVLLGTAKFIARATDARGRAGYFVAGDCDRPALTAISLYVRRFFGDDLESARLDDTKKFLAEQASVGNAKSSTDFYANYYSMLALFELSGPQSAEFKACNRTVTTVLVHAQHSSTDGCSAGSWDVAQDAYLNDAGRTVGTALNVLTLEVYYRYALEKSKSR